MTNGAVSATACAAIRNLEPQTLQRFADCMIATLTDPEPRECARRALSSLGELQPLTLAQHAPSVAAMLDEEISVPKGSDDSGLNVPDEVVAPLSGARRFLRSAVR